MPDDDLLRQCIDAVKWLAGLSPDASAVVQGAELAGLVRQPRKRNRIFYAFVGLYERIQKLEAKLDREYMQRDEFADLLEETLLRVASDPDEDRRNRYSNILMNIASSDVRGPHCENRMIVRLAEELTTRHMQVLLAHEGSKTRDEMLLGRKAILEGRAQIPSFTDYLEDLVAFRLVERDMMNVAVSNSLMDGLTRTGKKLLKYMHDVDWGDRVVGKDETTKSKALKIAVTAAEAGLYAALFYMEGIWETAYTDGMKRGEQIEKTFATEPASEWTTTTGPASTVHLSAREVAAALGHSSPVVTMRHYVKEIAAGAARQQAAIEVLAAKTSAKTFGGHDDTGRQPHAL